MALRLFVCVFLLVVCLIISLARLGRLDWFPLRPASSPGAAKRTMLPRRLQPRTPDDYPACRLVSTPSTSGGLASAPVRPWSEVKSRRGVQPLLMVDNSDISPTRLTEWKTHRILASRGALPAPHF